MAAVLCKNIFQLMKRELRKKKGKMRQKKEESCRNSLDEINSNPKTNWNIKVMSLNCF